MNQPRLEQERALLTDVFVFLQNIRMVDVERML